MSDISTPYLINKDGTPTWASEREMLEGQVKVKEAELQEIHKQLEELNNDK